jgi:hypothetical protein
MLYFEPAPNRSLQVSLALTKARGTRNQYVTVCGTALNHRDSQSYTFLTD